MPPSCVTPSGLNQLKHYQSGSDNHYLARQIVNSHISDTSTETTAPHLELGVEDDGGIVLNNQGRREALLMLGRGLGAKWQRFIIYPDRYSDPAFRTNSTTAIKAAVDCGYKVEVTLACNHRQWESADQYGSFAGRVARRYDGLVSELTSCNEPNNVEDKWLQALPSKSLPQTERAMHIAAYNAIKAVNPNDEVVQGELSSSDSPLVFEQQVLECPPKEGPHCTPLPADGIAIHPYKRFKDWGDGPLPPLNLQLPPTAPEIGIDSLATYESFITAAYKNGLLATTANQKPGVLIDEYGMQAGIISAANWARLLTAVLSNVCADPNIKRLSLYQLDSNVNEEWNTALINRYGKPGVPFFVPPLWMSETNPQCMA